MEKIQNLILTVLIVVLLVLSVFLLNKFILVKTSFVSVNSSVASSVFLDNKFKGQTPIKIKVNTGVSQLKVVANANTFVPFETSIDVYPNTTSLVNIVFAQGANASNVVYFDRSDTSEPQVSIVSTPNLSKIEIDGQVRGFSPVKTILSPGKHTIESEFVGYENQNVEIDVKPGLRTVVLFSLAVDTAFIPIASASPVPSSSPVALAAKQVQILDTPTGFLKVRQDPSSSSTELGQVNVGETYKYLESNQDNSWHKIEFNNSFGWVSGQYSKVVEE
ncbi:MAG: PEGA domain-containing protein [Patescibacteria group bacterium]